MPNCHKVHLSTPTPRNIFAHMDESGTRDILPTFCAASLSRIPMLPDEMSHLAAIRKDLVHIRKTMNSIKDNMSVKDTNDPWPPLGKDKPRELNRTEFSTNSLAEARSSDPARLDIANHSSEYSITHVKENHKTAAELVRQQPTATNSSSGEHNGPAPGDDFTVVRRKSKRPKKTVNGCRTDTISFAGVKKKSVVCVSRLEQDTSTDAVTDFLSANKI